MGRPPAGNFKASAAMLAALPEKGTPQQFADALGVSVVTIRDWMNDANAPHTREETHCTLFREPFIHWMKSCGRYQSAPVIDYAEQVNALGQEAQVFVHKWSNSVKQPVVFVADFLKVLIAERKRF